MNDNPEKDQDGKKTDDAADKPAEQREDKGPPPLDKKIPEPPDNLRRRSDWFRKRSE